MKFSKGVLAKQSRKLAAIFIALGIVTAPVAASALATGDVGPWASTNSLNTASTTAGAVAYNGYLYNVGGRDSSLNALDSVQYAPLTGNGSVGAWTTSPNTLPSGQWRPGVVENNGYLYSLGGINGGGQVAGVYYAPINPDGSVGTWTATTSLPQATQSAGTAVYNNHIFMFGGGQAGGNVDTVISAPINPDGSVGAWTATTSLPQAERRQKVIEYNGYAYVVGGLTGSTSTSIFSAQLNNDGTVGPWTTLPVTIPVSAIDFSLSENNGYAYLIGGNDGSNLSSVYFAPLAAGGTLGTWTQSGNSLPVGEEGISSATYNNILYVIGGDNATNAALNSVYYAALTVPSSPPAAQTTSNSSNIGAPDTGHGAPGRSNQSNPLVVAIIGIATMSAGASLWLLRKQNKLPL